MKKNVKYVKNVLSKLNNDKVITREKLFYSIGILCILFMFINRFDNMLESKREEKLPVVEPIKEKEVIKKEKMSFKEKFKLSRAFHGPNGLFRWNGKTYHCKYKEEMEGTE